MWGPSLQIPPSRRCNVSTHQCSLFMMVLLTLAPLAGCLSSTTAPEVEVEVSLVETTTCNGPSYPEWNLSCAFPSFNLTDDAGEVHNLTSANGSERWVAYLSAYWCTHCKPTLDALDVALPDGHLLIFNKDDSDDNMTSWKAHMEDELNRSLDRPFLHAPWIASALQVQGIPHVVLVENATVLAVRIGLWDDPDAIRTWVASAAPESGYSAQLD